MKPLQPSRVADDLENPLKTSSNVPKIVAAMPRWILACRTFFSSLLARTFHTLPWGASPATVVFPLPLAHFGLFGGGASRLKGRQWRALLRKRLLHMVIVAVNFLEGSLNNTNVHLLGRSPNAVQRKVRSRLEALISTCDFSGHERLPLVPEGPVKNSFWICFTLKTSRRSTIALTRSTIEKDQLILRRAQLVEE